MGVKGLWQLLDSTSSPVTLESLENKVLAVDISIWINQAIKGYRDREGRPIHNAHLLGLFQRVAKLLFYNIKPIFVFDGGVPPLKKETLIRRRQRKQAASDESTNATKKILTNYLTTHIIDKKLDEEKAKEALLSSILPKIRQRKNEEDIFNLPTTSTSNLPEDDDDEEDDWEQLRQYQDAVIENEYQDMDDIDIHGNDFKSLPTEIRYTFLKDMKEMRKSHRLSRKQHMPEVAQDFSQFQLKKLLNRRVLQKEIECAEKEMKSQASGEAMGGCSFNELGGASHVNEARRIASDELTHIILIDKKKPLQISKNSQKEDEPIKIDRIIGHRYEIGNRARSTVSDISVEASDIFGSGKSEAGGGNLVFDSGKSGVMSESSDSDVEEILNTVDDVEELPKVENGSDVVPEMKMLEAMPSEVGSLRVKSDEKPVVVAVEDSSAGSSDDDFIEVAEDATLKSPNTEEIKVPEDIAPSDAASVVVVPLKEVHVEMEHSEPESNSTQQPERKSKYSEEDLREKKASVKAQNVILEAERARQERMAMSVTDSMTFECQSLLRLFGVPYVVGPMEAEAQCAKLDLLDLTDGTISDDSDIWLFGGRNVYRNFFNQNKHVELFRITDIESLLGLDREKMISVAMLTGSDYTDGIEGVGPITAMELLADFPGRGLSALIGFKNWWSKSQSKTTPPGNKFRAKLKTLCLGDGFPNPIIHNAYMEPDVDDSKEAFDWSTPDLDELRRFASEKFGWNQSRTDDLLLPVLKKLNSSRSQTTLDRFVTFTLRKEKLSSPSKRLKRIIDKTKGGHDARQSPIAPPAKNPRLQLSSESSDEAPSVKSAPKLVQGVKNPKSATITERLVGMGEANKVLDPKRKRTSRQSKPRAKIQVAKSNYLSSDSD